jgi:hypothetical protein
MSSKRAELLNSLLSHIANGEYDRYDGYIVFGASSVFDMIEDIAARRSERMDDSIGKALRELVSDVTLHRGRSRVARRVSLNQPRPFKPTTEESRRLLEALERHLGQKLPANSPEALPLADVEDAIDAELTREVLGILPNMVDRTLRLDDMLLDHIPNKDVQRYFHEAHRCYQYGFPIACAVLCRAILESALRSVCDPKGILEDEVRKKKFELKKDVSYFEELLKEAEKKDRLKLINKREALDIRDAGNDAIHGFEQFEEKWSSKLDDIVKNTRLALLDLYAHA